MQSLRRILALVHKEFLAILRDPKSRFVVIGPPLIQFFIFGYAATFDVEQVRYAVLDRSQTAASRALLARFAASDAFRFVRTIPSSASIDEVIDEQVARVVVHIGPEFERDLARGRTAKVQIVADGRNSNVASVAIGYASEIVTAFAQRRGDRAAAGAALSGPADGDPTQLGAAGTRLVDRAWFNENLRSRWYIVAPLGATISMVVVMLLASLSVAREREFGTFDQLLVAPFRQFELLIGKALPGMVLGMLDGLLLAAASVWWFELPFRGTIAALALALAAFVLAIVGVGLCVSAISTTMQQGLLGSFVFIMPSVILSGFTTPIANMPDWLQVLTYANPLRYAVTSLRAVFLEGADSTAIWSNVWPLLVISSLTLPCAAWLFRVRSD